MFESPACQGSLCGAILAKKASVCVVLTKQSRLSFYCSLHRICCGNSTPVLFSSRTSGQGYLIRYFVSSIEACENQPLAILAVLKARRILDCSSCTGPPCLAIVPDLLKTYKKLVTASNNEILLLPQSYTLP